MPDVAIFLLMVICTMIVDGTLHMMGATTWGRYFGYWGTTLLLISFAYSARKRKLIQFGKPAHFLRAHEFLAWLGSVMILVHGGIHFNAVLPWLAMMAMLVAVASGLTGKFLLKRSKNIVGARKDGLLAQGMSQERIDDQLYWDALVVDLMRQWRKIHFPITFAFAFLTLLHVTSVLLFWMW